MKKIGNRILSLLLAVLLLAGMAPMPAAAAESAGQMVISFEIYEPESQTIAFLREPELVEFSAEDTGLTIMKRLLGEENVSGGEFISSLTIDNITYDAATLEETLGSMSSWSFYRNNLAGGDTVTVKPQDGDVFRIIATTYDAGARFPTMPHDLDALYFTLAQADHSSQAYQDAITAIQKGPTEEEISDLLDTLSQAGIAHRVLIDGRTILEDRSQIPYLYRATLEADCTTAAAGDPVTITVTPESGMVLKEGSLRANGIPLTQAGEDTYTFSMPDQHVTVTAEYLAEDVAAANRLTGLTFTDDQGNTLPLDKPFQGNVFEYTLEISDSVFVDPETDDDSLPIHITADFAEGTTAGFDFFMYSYGYIFSATGNRPIKLSSGVASDANLSRTSLFMGASSFDNPIVVTPPAETGLPAKTYTITMKQIPTLSTLEITGSDNMVWNRPFQPTDRSYLITVPAGTSSITLTPTLTFEDSVDGDASSTIFINGVELTNPSLDVPLPEGGTQIAVTIRDGYGVENSYQLTVSRNPAIQMTSQLADALARKFTDKSGEWEVMDLAAYGLVQEDAPVTTAEARQAYLNTVIGKLAAADVNTATAAKSVIILKALGVDPQKLTTADGKALDAVAILKNLPASQDVYTAPYELLAFLQGDYGFSADRIAGLVRVLQENQSETGTYGYTYNGTYFDDLDTTAAVIAGLAPYAQMQEDSFGVKADAQAVIDKAVNALSAKQGSDGSLNQNPNTTAMAVIGLCAAGIDPASDTRFLKQDGSLLEGLLSLKNDTSDGFLYNGAPSALADDQGFRALSAVLGYQMTGGAYQVYDFHALKGSPAAATPEQGGDSGETPSGTMTVYFTLKGDTVHSTPDAHTSTPTWISRMAVKIPENGTVQDALIKALAAKNYTAQGADSGYVSAITTPDGLTLSEGDNGPRSGWMYTVDGKHIQKGMDACHLSEGAEILFHFTDDYAAEPDYEETFSDDSTETKPTPALFSDTKNHWAKDYISYLQEKKLLLGRDANTFAPDDVITRAEYLTLLARMSGAKLEDSTSKFEDVPQNAWFAPAAAWAEQQGIAQGADGLLLPDAAITRQDLAVLLLRYAQLFQIELPAASQSTTFPDDAQIASYAKEAVFILEQAGLFSGRDDGHFAPNETATRAETAKILAIFLLKYSK